MMHKSTNNTIIIMPIIITFDLKQIIVFISENELDPFSTAPINPSTIRRLETDQQTTAPMPPQFLHILLEQLYHLQK